VRKMHTLEVCLFALSCTAWAQNAAPDAQTTGTAPTPAPAQAAATTPAPTTPPEKYPLTLGPVTFSGQVDGYFGLNFNHPSSDMNDLYNFDSRSDTPDINLAKITAQHDPDPLGFRFDLGFGKAFQIMHATETAPKFFDHVEQMFVSYKPKSAGGFEADFGQFVTSAGAEVIESKDNWNYSRSLLFSWAIPYYHFGLRTTMPIGSHFTAGFQLVNGWNDLSDNNSGKTLGFTGNVTEKKFTWSNTFYAGPENPNTTQGWREMYDTVLLLTPSDNANYYINYDYGHNAFPTAGAAVWQGIAGAAHFQLNSWFALAPRAEWFSDTNGFSTGTAQALKEVTLTAEGKVARGLLARLEYRDDWSNQKFFNRGSTPGLVKNQGTLILGVVAFMEPKH